MVSKRKAVQGFSLIELLICAAVFGIVAAAILGPKTSVNDKAACLAAGGQWTEGLGEQGYMRFCTQSSQPQQPK